MSAVADVHWAFAHGVRGGAPAHRLQAWSNPGSTKWLNRTYGSRGKPGPATKNFRPAATKNGRNLCAHRWLKQVAPNGYSRDFKLYWDSLGKDRQEKYETDAKKLISDGIWTGNTVEVIVVDTSKSIHQRRCALFSQLRKAQIPTCVDAIRSATATVYLRGCGWKHITANPGDSLR
ncbi:hypothetical protein BDR06DRAFT_1022473 [Suillus hirtellus]|nr:hypothetical protein BDR06DRAFT_1022473 [Suillus hirtellus]